MVQDDIGFDEILSEKNQATDGAPAKGKAGKSPKLHDFDSRLARPLDRLAAAMADLVIFTPILALLIAPLRRQTSLAQMLGHEADWTVALATSLVFGASIFVLYQTIFIALWGATPGKRVFGIRVESVWDGKKPRPLQAFVRACGWSIELIFLGAPFAAVYGNEKRRPFHDRLADTVVVTSRKATLPAGLPTIPELTLASAITAAALGVLAVAAISSLARLKSEFQDGAAIAADAEAKGLLCHAVTEAREQWTPNLGNADSVVPATAAEPESRLDVALALFGAESLDENCLQMEADYSIWRNEQKTTAYLAQALVHADDEDLYESYLEKSCDLEPKSFACGIAHLLRHDAQAGSDAADTEEKANRAADEQFIEEMLQTADARTPSYFKVWMIRRLMEEGRYRESLVRLNEVSPHRSIGYFFARERMRALWNLDRKSDARIAMRASIESLEPAQRVEMAQWLCFNEASTDGCTDNARYACNLMRAAVDHEDRWFESPEIVATYVHGESCRGDLNESRLSQLGDRLPDGQGKDYVQALTYLRKNDKLKATEIFHKIASEKEQNETFFVEANVQLAELASTPAELTKVKSAWMEMQPSELWHYFGLRLANRFTAMRSWNDSMEVGLRMIESDHNDRQVYRTLVVAAYRAGNARLAMRFLDSLRSMDGSENSTAATPSRAAMLALNPKSASADPSKSSLKSRLPASQADEFTVVSQELLKKGDN